MYSTYPDITPTRRRVLQRPHRSSISRQSSSLKPAAWLKCVFITTLISSLNCLPAASSSLELTSKGHPAFDQRTADFVVRRFAMTESQNKAPTQETPEQQAQPPQGQPIYALQQPGAAPYATVGGYPPYYPYPPPPTDANGHPTDPNVANAGPPGTYMMAFPPPPPGMIYAYTSSQGDVHSLPLNS